MPLREAPHPKPRDLALGLPLLPASFLRGDLLVPGGLSRPHLGRVPQALGKLREPLVVRPRGEPSKQLLVTANALFGDQTGCRRGLRERP